MSFPHSKPSAARTKIKIPLHSLHEITIWTPPLTYTCIRITVTPLFPTHVILLYMVFLLPGMSCSPWLLAAYRIIPSYLVTATLPGALRHLSEPHSENFLLWTISQPCKCFSCFSHHTLLHYLLARLSSQGGRECLTGRDWLIVVPNAKDRDYMWQEF